MLRSAAGARRSFDIKFIQAQADEIELLEEQARVTSRLLASLTRGRASHTITPLPSMRQAEKSKPLFIFYKAGEELARINGASAVNLQGLVEMHATKKPQAD